MLVYDVGFCILFGNLDCGFEEGLKIANEVKFQRVFLIVVYEPYGAFVGVCGIRIDGLLRAVAKAVWDVLVQDSLC